MEPLLRLAKKTGRDDTYAALRAKFPDVPHEPLGPQEGQVVVVVEAGLSPVKRSLSRNYEGSDDPIEIPVYQDRGHTPQARVAVGNQEATAVTVTSLERVAKVHLTDRIDRMLAKQLASLLVKGGLAAGVGAITKSKEVGFLTFLVLNALNEPDLRSWLSLPAEFQLARFRVPGGTHTVRIDAGGSTVTREVEVKPGRIQLVVVRRY
jgi:hypothetical protein